MSNLPTLEEALSALEKHTQALQSPEITLEQALEHYQAGQILAAQCQQLLEKADLLVQTLRPNLTDDELDDV